MAFRHNDEFLPLNHGFDYYYGIPYSNDMDKINNNPIGQSMIEMS